MKTAFTTGRNYISTALLDGQETSMVLDVRRVTEHSVYVGHPYDGSTVRRSITQHSNRQTFKFNAGFVFSSDYTTEQAADSSLIIRPVSSCLADMTAATVNEKLLNVNGVFYFFGGALEGGVWKYKINYNQPRFFSTHDKDLALSHAIGAYNQIPQADRVASAVEAIAKDEAHRIAEMDRTYKGIDLSSLRNMLSQAQQRRERYRARLSRMKVGTPACTELSDINRETCEFIRKIEQYIPWREKQK
jgi:hypothetical protein